MTIPPKKYEVGYGRPPKATRWKKGQCGNPNRVRKRARKRAVEMIDEFFAVEIDVVENGISRRVTNFEAIVLQLWRQRANVRSTSCSSTWNSRQVVAAGAFLHLRSYPIKIEEEGMADYEVGYKKPPRHSQFKAGNRANPRGRGKRKIPTETDIIRNVLNCPAEFSERGKSKRAPRIEIMIKRFGAAALKGDPAAAALLLEMRARLEKHGDINPIRFTMTERDMNAA
jgi:hypothetical protein